MLGFFPIPYPDESLLSLIGRFQRLTGWTPSILFRNWGCLTSNPHIQRNIGWLTEQLPRRHPLASEDIITERTLFRVLILGRDKNAAEALRKEMQQKGNASRLVSERQSRLNSCPLCYKEQIELFGVAYWKRSHQPMTVTACHTHGCVLEHTAFRTRHPDHPIPPTPTITMSPKPAQTWEVNHARQVAELLNTNIDTATWRLNLRTLLEDKGFTHQTKSFFRLNIPMIQERIRSKNNPAFAEETNLSANPVVAARAIRQELEGKSPGYQKLLALACLMETDSEKLSTTPTTNLSKFPCRNRLAPCYLQETITAYSFLHLRLAFECPKCNFRYSISKKDRTSNRASMCVKIRVIKTGPIWDTTYSAWWRVSKLHITELQKRTGLTMGQLYFKNRTLGLKRRRKDPRP